MFLYEYRVKFSCVTFGHILYYCSIWGVSNHDKLVSFCYSRKWLNLVYIVSTNRSIIYTPDIPIRNPRRDPNPEEQLHETAKDGKHFKSNFIHILRVNFSKRILLHKCSIKHLLKSEIRVWIHKELMQIAFTELKVCIEKYEFHISRGDCTYMAVSFRTLFSAIRSLRYLPSMI